MKGYSFIKGVDGFGEDITPALEEKIYTDFKKAFNHLVELNHDFISNNDYPFYERGYGEDEYPDTDKELALAEKEKKWSLFDALIEKHRITDENEINSQFVFNEDTYYSECLPCGLYALVETEIIN